MNFRLSAVLLAAAALIAFPPPQKGSLKVLHASRQVFAQAIQYAADNPLPFDESNVNAGVVPHHNIGAALAAGFFARAAQHREPYDTVLLIGPNHLGDEGDVIVSKKDWNFDQGVACDTVLADALLHIKLDGVVVRENDKRMESDHAAAALVPYINHYLPGVKIAPMLVSRTLSYENTLRLADTLADILADTDKRILLVCSIDFSHGLTSTQAAQKDDETLSAMQRRDYRTIYAFDNTYLDCPGAMIIFLRCLEALETEPVLLAHTDASQILRTRLTETTSYFVFSG